MSSAPHYLHQEIMAARTLRAQIETLLRGPVPEGSDANSVEVDQEAVADTLEGEVNLEGQITRALELMQNDLILVEGAALRLKAMQERKSRFDKRIDATRALVEQALQISGKERMDFPMASIYLSGSAAKLFITDELEVPAKFYEAQPAKLDKTALGKALRDRAKALAAIDKAVAKKKVTDEEAAAQRASVEIEFPPVPGAHLEDQGQSLTLSWK
ncbi:siphovirus Gp157 family protein [Phreatobacter sp. HK31-P]